MNETELKKLVDGLGSGVFSVAVVQSSNDKLEALKTYLSDKFYPITYCDYEKGKEQCKALAILNMSYLNAAHFCRMYNIHSFLYFRFTKKDTVKGRLWYYKTTKLSQVIHREDDYSGNNPKYDINLTKDLFESKQISVTYNSTATSKEFIGKIKDTPYKITLDGHFVDYKGKLLTMAFCLQMLNHHADKPITKNNIMWCMEFYADKVGFNAYQNNIQIKSCINKAMKLMDKL